MPPSAARRKQPLIGRDGIGTSLFVSALVAVCATAGCSHSSQAGVALPQVQRVSPNGGVLSPIQHVVVMVQENHSFDDFFATFPGADGATYGLMKTPSGDVQVPLKQAPLTSHSIDHQHQSFEIEYDHGKMDGFNLVGMAIKRGVKVPAGTYPYRYVNPKYIKPYWEIAQQYVLGDHMFMTQSSSSFTAHQDLISAGTPVGNGNNVIDFPVPANWGCGAAPGTVTSIITPQGKELRGKGPFPCFTYATLRDLLDAKGVSWLYYTNTSLGSVWNAFDAIKAVREGPEWQTNIVIPETQILTAASSGQLPAVSWVIPDTLDSDHPGGHSDTGPSWIASVVNAIGQSPYWNSTAIIVVWDDWGGQYDHVVPPQLDGQGLGMRVPFLLVSAYARETSPNQPGYISHTQYEFGSIVKFIEDNWHLGALGNTDVRASSIVDCFDFNKPARPFVSIQAKYSKEYFERRPPSGLPLDDN
jgi:phospholipase C